MKYRVQYDNDTGPDDEGFGEWWDVVYGVVEVCRCRDEANAMMIAEALNNRVLDPIVPKPGSGLESEALSR